jgi:hypothetical protein
VLVLDWESGSEALILHSLREKTRWAFASMHRGRLTRDDSIEREPIVKQILA